jgi:hypothetical protein
VRSTKEKKSRGNVEQRGKKRKEKETAKEKEKINK